VGIRVARTVEASDGLALLGSARVGPIGFPVPVVALSRVPSGPPGRGGHALTIDSAAGRSEGRRGLLLSDAGQSLALDYAIPTPEVSGVPGAAEEAGPGAWVVHAPLSEADSDRLRAARPGLVVLGNARVLFHEGAPFVRAILQLRDVAGGGAVLWAPRVALPHRLAILAYLGVDVLDTVDVALRARAGEFLDPTLGSIAEAPARAEGWCGCPVCRRRPPGPVGEHAEAVLSEEMARVRGAIRAGRLRELVEARLGAEPLLAEILRYADRDLAALLDERTPVTGEAMHVYVLRESQRRPEVLRFRARFLERYRSPPSKRVLLLVPCSRTKPYRGSRSHRRFSGALEGLPHLERLHTVSVTSPLGLVPRELEDTFPSRHYDIPVTGEWDENERVAVVEALRAMVRNGPYTTTLFHLDPEEYRFLADAGFEGQWTLMDGRTTTNEALASLRRAADAALRDLRGVDGGPLTTVREELAAVAAFQFGPEAARLLFAPPVRLAGRPWFQRVTDGHGTDLATWREPRGLFQLTVAGGARMLPAHPLEVEVDPKVSLLGDLFTPGVLRADPKIREGDAVLLVRDGALLGVGEAGLPGPLMTQLARGTAVWVRHRVHPPSGSAPPTRT
jgi:archaeosine synthase alpha-subunit